MQENAFGQAGRVVDLRHVAAKGREVERVFDWTGPKSWEVVECRRRLTWRQSFLPQLRRIRIALHQPPRRLARRLVEEDCLLVCAVVHSRVMKERLSWKTMQGAAPVRERRNCVAE